MSESGFAIGLLQFLFNNSHFISAISLLCHYFLLLYVPQCTQYGFTLHLLGQFSVIWPTDNCTLLCKQKKSALAWVKLEIRRDKLALQYILKLKANPENPAYDVVFNPKHQELYKNKQSATESFGIHCKKLLKEAKIDVGEIAINSIPDVPIWDSQPVTVDFTLSEFDKSSTSSTVFKSRFNEVKQKYLDFCHIYTDGSKVETKVASAYVCPYGTRGYRLRSGCSIFYCGSRSD